VILGYARVSTDDPTTALQRDALKRARCKLVFEDKGLSGIDRKRPALAKALQRIERGDVLTVWRLDRLGRSLRDLIAIMGELEQRGAHFRSITEHIDTTTASGKRVFHMMGALAEFERSLIVERTQAGLKAAKRRGIQLGRRPLLSPEQVRHAVKRIHAGALVGQTARVLGVSERTLARAIQRHEQGEASDASARRRRA
jgi:DNA invertase Pin-like site-specific DNA recombinase